MSESARYRILLWMVWVQPALIAIAICIQLLPELDLSALKTIRKRSIPVFPSIRSAVY